ncbi:MAG: hypothetical protein ACP5RD_05910 [bacterium]
MINSLNYSQNNKDLNQINLNNNSINDKNSKIINTIDPTYKNYNKLNLSLKIINQFENSLDSKININDSKIFSIIYKLNQLGINGAGLLLKQIDNRINDTNEKEKFYKELNELLDILLSKDLDKKLHPEVIKAIDNPFSGINISEARLEKEFKTLREFSKKLILDLLLVLSNPNSISQENKGTCSQTVIERAIAERMHLNM